LEGYFFSYLNSVILVKRFVVGVQQSAISSQSLVEQDEGRKKANAF